MSRGLAELHVHLEGTVRYATALELAAKHGVGPPPPYEYSDFSGFLNVYAGVNRCLIEAGDFERVVLEHAEVMAAGSIAYAEISFNPTLHAGDAWVGGLDSGRRLAAGRHGVDIRWLVELSREAAPAANAAALQIALRLDGVVGLGLVGDESLSVAPLAELFLSGRGRGLGVMPHAGQTAGPAAIREVMTLLHADRIAHGVAAAEDPELLALLADRRLPLCVCPSSNRKIGLRPDFAALAGAGVLLTANSDDPPLVGTGLARELGILAKETGESVDALTARSWESGFGG